MTWVKVLQTPATGSKFPSITNGETSFSVGETDEGGVMLKLSVAVETVW